MPTKTLLTVVLVTLGCGGIEPTSGVEIPAGGYKGEDLYRGIFFGSGPVASRLPEIWGQAKVVDEDVFETPESLAPKLAQTNKGLQALGVKQQVIDSIHKSITDWSRTPPALRKKQLTPEQRKHARIVIRREILDQVRIGDASFFLRFGTEMQSGDPLRVDAALREGGKRLVEAAALVVDAHRAGQADGRRGHHKEQTRCGCGGCGSCGSCGSCGTCSCGDCDCDCVMACGFIDDLSIINDVSVAFDVAVVAVVAIAAVMVAVVVLAIVPEPSGGGSTTDDHGSGLRADKTLPQQVFVAVVAARFALAQ